MFSENRVYFSDILLTAILVIIVGVAGLVIAIWGTE